MAAMSTIDAPTVRHHSGPQRGSCSGPRIPSANMIPIISKNFHIGGIHRYSDQIAQTIQTTIAATNTSTVHKTSIAFLLSSFVSE